MKHRNDGFMKLLLAALPFLVMGERPCESAITPGAISQIDYLLEVLPMIRDAFIVGEQEGRRQGMQYQEADRKRLSDAAFDEHVKYEEARRALGFLNEELQKAQREIAELKGARDCENEILMTANTALVQELHRNCKRDKRIPR